VDEIGKFDEQIEHVSSLHLRSLGSQLFHDVDYSLGKCLGRLLRQVVSDARGKEPLP
jgi:hypothetical protein